MYYTTPSEVFPEALKVMPETALVATGGRENWQGFWTDPFSMLSIISFDCDLRVVLESFVYSRPRDHIQIHGLFVP